MAKLFVFGIGGTGERVIKSFTMLLASGVKINCSEIIPIIIDPDRAGGDLNRTVNILRDYQLIRKELNDFRNNTYFNANVVTLNEYIARKGGIPSIIDGFRFELDGVQNDRFRDFIDYGTLDFANQKLVDLLFSEENLNSNLEVGFKGNPNIGSVVLNQFTKSKAFEDFARNFDKDDRIFIISSIFGGTGAAGFPLLVKNIREANINNNHYDFLQNALIGAITVQPYFKVSADDKSKIDSKGFISKTKAALHYYFKNVTGNRSINSLYYIGDGDSSEVENNEGGENQKNNAHFIEFASALAIVDFANAKELQTVNGRAASVAIKEFGIKNDSRQISFGDLFDETLSIVKKNLTEYFLFNIFCKENYGDGQRGKSISHPYANMYKNKINANFFTLPFFKNLEAFNRSFRIWLGEMEMPQTSFIPFDLKPKLNSKKEVEDIEVPNTRIFSTVRGIKEIFSFRYNGSVFNLKDYELYISKLNKAATVVGDISVNNRFMSVFSIATKEAVNQKLF